jgi:hypothetical protein
MQHHSGPENNGEDQGLHQGLPADVLAELSAMPLAETSQVPQPATDRVSLKDLPYVDVLRDSPELAEGIGRTMKGLEDRGMDMPVLHITSRGIRLADGAEQSSGFLESMMANGLRARDTNVAAFVERSTSTSIADPRYFDAHPDKLLHAMAISLGHYAHHGSRTNKASLGEAQNAGVGLPTMLVIDATSTPLLPGSDYDDHFRLGEDIPPSHIMGEVDLGGRKPINPEDVAAVTRQFLDVVDAYLSKQDG